jgi:HPt (histidine-containing phosphotransfer) domain-containing protein
MTNSQSAPFDLNGLYEMYGKETVQELLQMSVDEARGLLVQIDEGISERDSKIVMAAAHQLKGLASTMTINELARLSLELETTARQEDWTTISQLKDKLAHEFDSVANYISSVLTA